MTRDASPRVRVVIVGAGVAGAILARRLAQVPAIDLTVLERAEPEVHLEAGTGLNLGPNAVQALSLLDPALAESLRRAGLPWRTLRKSLVDGTPLAHLVLRDVADCDGCRIRWADLYRVLRADCDAVIRYGCVIADIDRGRDGTRTAVSWIEGGERHHLRDIDLLIGADGRYSDTRNRFSGPPAVRHLGVVIFRLLVPDTSGGLIDDHEQWFNGPNRLLAFRVNPDHVYIAGSFPILPGDGIDDDAKGAAFLHEAYTPARGEVAAPVRWLIDTIGRYRAEIHWARMQDHALLYAEPDAAVLYVGDAAHGMVPTLGQGATQAIEDACFVGAWIAREVAAGRREPRAWLDAIEVARAERMAFVVELSRVATGVMLAGGDPVAGFANEGSAESMGRLRRLFRDLPPIGDAPPDRGAAPS